MISQYADAVRRIFCISTPVYCKIVSRLLKKSRGNGVHVSTVLILHSDVRGVDPVLKVGGRGTNLYIHNYIYVYIYIIICHIIYMYIYIYMCVCVT